MPFSSLNSRFLNFIFSASNWPFLTSSTSYFVLLDFQLGYSRCQGLAWDQGLEENKVWYLFPSLHLSSSEVSCVSQLLTLVLLLHMSIFLFMAIEFLEFSGSLFIKIHLITVRVLLLINPTEIHIAFLLLSTFSINMFAFIKNLNYLFKVLSQFC